jgi:ATP-dependent Clp protease ATP-binding subunit ClpA
MWEKLTDQARQTVLRGESEARRRGHEYVGTEHLLLGLIQEESGIAVEVLNNLGVSRADLRRAVEEMIQGAFPGDVQWTLPWTPRAKLVLKYALEEARYHAQETIGPEHLLLGLLGEEEGVAAQALLNVGLSLADGRAELIRVLNVTDVRQGLRTAPDGPSPPGFPAGPAREGVYRSEEVAGLQAGASAEPAGKGPGVPSLNVPSLNRPIEERGPLRRALSFLGRLFGGQGGANEPEYPDFTALARKAMQLANYEAQRFNHEYVGTEHVLLGLIKEGSGVAANVLLSFGLELRTIRREVERIVQAGPDMVTLGRLPLTPRTQSVLAFAREEAREFGDAHVGPEHLLLGLLREQEGVAAQVLMNLGARLDQVRVGVMRAVGGGEVEGRAGPVAPP